MRCYRLHAFVLWCGLSVVAMAVLFSIVAVLTAFQVIQTNILDSSPIRLAVAMIGIVLLGAFIVAWYSKYRLVITDDEILQIGFLGPKRVNLSEVTKVQWRLFTRDVVLWAGKSRLSIEIDALSTMDQAAVASFLHQRFPLAMHQGWEQARRPLHIVKIEPIHWGRIVGGTGVASALAIPLLFLAAWIDPTRDFQRTFLVIFGLSLAAILYGTQKLGWIVLKPRLETSSEPVNTLAPTPSPSASRSPVAQPSRE